MAPRDSPSTRLSIPISSSEPNGLCVAFRNAAAWAAMRDFMAAVTKLSLHMSLSWAVAGLAVMPCRHLHMQLPGAMFAHPDLLVDVKCGIIMDVEASRAIRQAEVGTARVMIERTEQRLNMKPNSPEADSAYGSGANLNWLVEDKKIAPHIPAIEGRVAATKSARSGHRKPHPTTFSRSGDWSISRKWLHCSRVYRSVT